MVTNWTVKQVRTLQKILREKVEAQIQNLPKSSGNLWNFPHENSDFVGVKAFSEESGRENTFCCLQQKNTNFSLESVESMWIRPCWHKKDQDQNFVKTLHFKDISKLMPFVKNKASEADLFDVFDCEEFSKNGLTSPRYRHFIGKTELNRWR